ncbi:hypothetical protein KR026_009553 [Drosophila bipectinata]|nr:hypothetical protein KR026_009553 [Drosophila bipectinata]
MAIRQTWMHYGSRRDIGMAFVLGRGTNATANERLDRENMMYADMIRGNFIDSYYNLTLKTISALEWSLWHCPLAKYVLKTDDDMFINMPKLMKFIDTLSAKRRIYGRRAENWMPVRNKQSKYFVSYRQFTARFFPYFTTGPAYLLTGDIVGELYAQSLATAYLKLEDVFLTGIVADILGVPRVNVKEIANTNTKAWACRVRDRITIHMVSPNEQFDLWKKLLDTSIACT